MWGSHDVPFIITCKLHGDFMMNDYAMTYRQYPCIKCKAEAMAARGLAKYTAILTSRYPELDFSNFTSFTKVKDKIKVVCREHGEFHTTIDSLTSASSTTGCPKCALVLRGKNRAYGISEYESRNAGRGYTYTGIDDNYIYYTCSKHGPIKQAKAHHLSGRGCKRCGQLHGKKRLVLSKVVDNLHSIHHNKYTYHELIHDSEDVKILYSCPVHGEVLQSYQNHRKGKACPTCNTGFRDRGDTVPTHLYVVYFKDLNLWKLGVTKFSLSKRFSSEPLAFTECYIATIPTGTEAFELEHTIAGSISEYKYRGPKVLFSGNTELYTEDITKTVTEIVSKYLSTK